MSLLTWLKRGGLSPNDQETVPRWVRATHEPAARKDG